MEVYEKIIFLICFSSGQGKVLFLQHIWFYIIIPISKVIHKKFKILTFQINPFSVLTQHPHRHNVSNLTQTQTHTHSVNEA